MDTIKNISLFLVVGFVIIISSFFLRSDFIPKFLNDNLILLLFNVLAINTATSGIVLTKLKEISELNNEFDFSESYVAIKNALREQVILILVAIMILVGKESEILKVRIPYFDIIANSLLCAVFLFALQILWDTGKAIFLIIKK